MLTLSGFPCICNRYMLGTPLLCTPELYGSGMRIIMGGGGGAQTTSACMKWGLRGAHFTTDIGTGSAHITGVPISLLQRYKGIIMVTLNPAQWAVALKYVTEAFNLYSDIGRGG